MTTKELTPITSMEPSVAGEIVQAGGTLQRAQAGFVTAVTVQKPRDRMSIIKACEEEAAIAGDEFFYAWTVKDKEGKKHLVEGPSVYLANAAVRNWGNAGVMINVDETQDTYIFTATFVDLETGFNLQRAFRQKKSRNIGKYDKDRAEDIVFQIGQSKAIRNVVVNALPSWLISKMMARAKDNIIERINKKGLAQAKQDTIAFFARYNITADRIEAKIQKKADAWDAQDLAMLYGAIKTLTEGVESPDELFPPLTGPTPTYDIPEKELAFIEDCFNILEINQAERSMKLAACKGNSDKVQELIAELKEKIIHRKKEEPEKKEVTQGTSPNAEDLFGKEKGKKK